jgi:hypothetical protein
MTINRSRVLRVGRRARPGDHEEVRQEAGVAAATYEAAADPYCYAGTSVLRNIPGELREIDW